MVSQDSQGVILSPFLLGNLKFNSTTCLWVGVLGGWLELCCSLPAGRPPGPEMEYCTDRESYSLAAGLALGMVCLGVSCICAFPCSTWDICMLRGMTLILNLECHSAVLWFNLISQPFLLEIFPSTRFANGEIVMKRGAWRCLPPGLDNRCSWEN